MILIDDKEFFSRILATLSGKGLLVFSTHPLDLKCKCDVLSCRDCFEFAYGNNVFVLLLNAIYCNLDTSLGSEDVCCLLVNADDPKTLT